MVGAVRATATCAVGILRLIGTYGSSFRLRFYPEDAPYGATARAGIWPFAAVKSRLGPLSASTVAFHKIL